MTSTHIGCPSATVGTMLVPPSPLPWLPPCHCHCHCRHCCCHCHVCHHLCRHQHHFCCYCYCFLVFALMLPLLLPLLPAPAIVTVGCRHHCHCCHSRKLLPPASSATTPASVLPLFLPLFSLVMFKILLRPRNILNICVAVPCPLQSLPLFLPLSAAASEDLKT